MEDNQAFIICVQSGDKEYYLGDRDGIMTKIRSAIFYHDEMYAKSELDYLINEYKNTENTFLNDSSKLSIKKVEINII